MSDYVRNKGKLIPSGIHPDDTWNDSTWDDIYDSEEYMVIDGEIYIVEYEIQNDICYDFADVEVDDDGVIHFHTLHHNGGCGLEEVIEGELG